MNAVLKLIQQVNWSGSSDIPRPKERQLHRFLISSSGRPITQS